MGEGNERRFVFDIQPYSFQQEILDKLNAEREVLGYTRNLVVAATGCGKTVISAFDYARYCKKNPGKNNTITVPIKEARRLCIFPCGSPQASWGILRRVFFDYLPAAFPASGTGTRMS